MENSYNAKKCNLYFFLFLMSIVSKIKGLHLFFDEIKLIPCIPVLICKNLNLIFHYLFFVDFQWEEFYFFARFPKIDSSNGVSHVSIRRIYELTV